MEKYQKLFNWVFCLLIVITAACKSGGRYLTTGETRLVNDGVRLLKTHIADDVSKKGPKAWLNYFDESQDFFWPMMEDWASKIIILQRLL